MDMKKILYLLLALSMAVFSGCDKNKNTGGSGTEPEPEPVNPSAPTLKEEICAEWHTSVSSIGADIYASFSSDGTFELYQKFGEGVHRLYRGKWGLEENVISGTYNDGESWSSTYEVEVMGSTMTWTSVNEAKEKTSYTKKAIPEDVKENCIIEVKSDNSGNIIW